MPHEAARRPSLPGRLRNQTEYGRFEVVGFELEYAIVDSALNPLCVAEQVLAEVAGRSASDARLGATSISNELAAHVLELKDTVPSSRLPVAERALHAGVRSLAALLAERFGARLLPTGMHPWMRLDQTRLWTRGGRRIYATYARLFPVQAHGWLNVQSCQLNLPFGTDAEAVALYNAIALLLPYLPALAASSPLVEGKIGPQVDNRLAFYAANQASLPVIAGDVVPEYITSLAQFRREVLGPIYRALDTVPGGSVLRRDWVNSRGAIPRFDRRAIEIRVLDSQECVRMDVAIAAFVRGVLRWLVAELESGRLRLPPHRLLVSDYRAVVRRGLQATVDAPHLAASSVRGRTPVAVRDVLVGLLEVAHAHLPETEQFYLALVARRIAGGNLSERIAARLSAARIRGRTAGREHMQRIYEALADCLVANRPWED
jgi:gamma-glutamyl:cysteine ligase YbdK (ATP-grasp superfamily)